MSESEVLGEEGRARTKKGAEGAESESNEAKHRDRIRAEGESPRSLWDSSEVRENEGPTAPGRLEESLARHRGSREN